MEMGGTYREEGRLTQRIKQALEQRPAGRRRTLRDCAGPAIDVFAMMIMRSH